MTPSSLSRLNALPARQAEAELLACCGSRAWAREMVDGRPYADVDLLFEEAERVWWSIGPADWLEAFRAHPRIGERKPAHGSQAGEAGDSGPAATSPADSPVAERTRHWSQQEQAGTRAADRETLDALAAGNRDYEQRFGFIFLICATGKTAHEMLDELRRRMHNDPDTELSVAASEQSEITRLRLEKLLSP
jgi:OHCU decarboxylase